MCKPHRASERLFRQISSKKTDRDGNIYFAFKKKGQLKKKGKDIGQYDFLPQRRKKTETYI